MGEASRAEQEVTHRHSLESFCCPFPVIPVILAYTPIGVAKLFSSLAPASLFADATAASQQRVRAYQPRSTDEPSLRLQPGITAE